MKLFSKEYNLSDDMIWEIVGNKVIFTNNGEFFAEILIQELIMDRVLAENNKGVKMFINQISLSEKTVRRIINALKTKANLLEGSDLPRYINYRHHLLEDIDMFQELLTAIQGKG
jgi:hypothetical protein